MNNQGYPRPMFWFLAGQALLALLWGLICLIDLILHPFVPDTLLQSVPGRLIVGLLIAPGAILIGGLILRREKRNLVGLLMINFGGAMLAATLRNDITDPVAVKIAGWYFASGAFAIPSLLLVFYFPNGRAFPPRLARWIDAFLFLMTVLWLFGTFFGAPFPVREPNNNPFYLPIADPVFDFMRLIWPLELTILVILAPYSLIMRYRHGDRRQRLQMNWFASYFLIFFGVLLVVMLINTMIGGIVFPAIVSTLFYLALFTLPVLAVGNAILRHKLYGVDIIIRRTLVYTVLTAILAVIYFGGIILAQQLFHVVAGENSDLAIVISTLAIAALFSPIRRRVQNVIDRRLYRRKYNVEKTLAQFQQNLRDEVDIETLKANLLGVVSETMQPAKIALWVKE